MSGTHDRTIVIIGGVAGGASAAARARRCNEHARIIMYERDAHVSFANCGLPYFVGGEITDRDKLLVATPQLLADRFCIDVCTHSEVTSIDREGHTVTVRNTQTGTEQRQHYDRLIISTGASPIVPRVGGTDAQNVFALRNLDDADRMIRFITETSPRRAVVVGAGFIGLEMVEQLARRDIQVSLVELADQVLTPLDPEMARMVERELIRHQVTLYLADGLESLRTQDDRAVAVRLNSGTQVAADMVVLGIGVRPNTGLAVGCGLALGSQGGIAVNDRMQTSDPHIYAVGDAVEYPHGVTGGAVRVALGGPANRSGRVAGENAATDADVRMPAVLGTAIVRVFDTTAAMTGLSIKHAARLGRAARAAVVPAGHHAGYYPGSEPMVLKLIYDPDTGKVLGASAVGGAGVDKRIDVIATAIHFGATVEALAGVDLAYAPPFGSAKDPVHLAAFVAANDRSGFSPLAPIDADVSGCQIVDVRTPQEFEQSRLPGAELAPLHELRERLTRFDPSRPTVVVCQGGLRAHVGARILRQHGFGDVRNLTGGMGIQVLRDPQQYRLAETP